MPRAEDPPLVRSAALTLPYVNATSTETQGLDVDLICKRSIGAAGELNIEFNYTRVLLYDLDAYGLTCLTARRPSIS